MNEAYKKGVELRKMGKSIEYNPYRHKGTADQYESWRKGWTDENEKPR